MRNLFVIGALMMSTAAFAGGTAPASTTPAPAPTTTAAAPVTATVSMSKATGVVKAIDTTKNTLTLTASGKDWTFATTGLTLDPTVKVGANVDVTYHVNAASAIGATGTNTATVIALHK